MKGPFAGIAQQDVEKQIREAACAVGVPEIQVEHPWALKDIRPMEFLVLMGLKKEQTVPVARRALRRWAEDETRPGWQMAETILLTHPHPADIPLLKRDLFEPDKDGGDEVGASFDLGRLGDTLGRAGYTGDNSGTLEMLAKIGTPEAKTLLRQIATDRSRTGPDRAVLRGIGKRCAGHYLRAEADALASERILALGYLDDEKLLRSIQKDRKEPAFLRRWCGYLLKGTVPWRKRTHRIHLIPAPCLYVPNTGPIGDTPPEF